MSLKRIFLKEIYFRVFPALRISEDFDGGDDDNDDFRSQCVAIYCNSLAIISSVCNLEKAAWYKMISAAMEISNEKKTSNKKVIAWTKRNKKIVQTKRTKILDKMRKKLPRRQKKLYLALFFKASQLYLQAPCQVELENWVNSIHSACAAAFARWCRLSLSYYYI